MSFESYLGAVVEAETKAGATKRDLDQMIEEIVGIFKDPIVLYPSGWMDTVPDRIYDMIRVERFLQQMKAKGEKVDKSTDAEALAYLYSASLVAPMGPEWTHIYMWLGRDWMPEGAAKGELAPKELSRDEQAQLDDLKRWIQQKKTTGRKGKAIYPLGKVPGKKGKKKAAMGCPYGPEIIEAEY